MKLQRIQWRTSAIGTCRATAERRCCLLLRCQAQQPASTRHAAMSRSAQHKAALAWSNALSQQPVLEHALDEALTKAWVQHPDDSPNLAVCFWSSSFTKPEAIGSWLKERVPSLQCIVGSSGFGVIAEEREVEQQPALSLVLASLPDTVIRGRHLSSATLPDGDASPAQWHDLLQLAPHPHTSFVVLADPTFSGLQDLLQGLDFAFPGSVTVGGLSSASMSRSDQRNLLLWHQAQGSGTSADFADGMEEGTCVEGVQVMQTGAVVLGLQGGVAIEPMIAQGCRPLSGQLYGMDSCLDNVVLQASALDGSWTGTPVDLLKRELAQVDPAQQRSVAANLLLGIAPDLFKRDEDLGPGDFLVRPLIGVVPVKGAIALGDAAVVGARFQLMVRDKEGAISDLKAHVLDIKKRELLRSFGTTSTPTTAAPADAPEPCPSRGDVLGTDSSRTPGDSTQSSEGLPAGPSGAAGTGQQVEPAVEGSRPGRVVGALMFSCNGRGQGLYGEPHVDVRTVQEFLQVPCAGFMCNGEVGPIAGVTYIHGFTCAVGIVREVDSTGV